MNRHGFSILLLGPGGLFTFGSIAGQAPPLELVPVSSIGVLSGEPALEFGHITALERDPETGHLFALDRLTARLSVFDSTGALVAQVGRRGEGPGEFQFGLALARGSRTIDVLDPGNFRISKYELKGASLELVDEVRVPFEARVMCRLRDHYYLLQYHQGQLVHRTDLRAKIQASFGKPFRDEDEVMAHLTAWGLMTCDSGSNSVFVASSSATASIRRYGPGGTLLWDRSLPGKVLPTITRNAMGGVSWRDPENGEASEATVSLTVLDEGTVLAQYGENFTGMGNLEDIVEVTSVFLDLDTGAVLDTRTDLPRIDYVSGDRLYSRANDPYPRILVYRR